MSKQSAVRNKHDDKVVEGTPAQFDESTAEHDTVESVVEVSQIKKRSEEYFNNLLVQNVDIFKLIEIEATDAERKLLPKIAYIHSVTFGLGVSYRPRSKCIADFLELPENYGADIRASGLYEKIGLKNDDNIPFDTLKSFFPEFEKFALIERGSFKATKNPYLSLYTFDQEDRLPYIAITEFALEKQMIAPDDGNPYFSAKLIFPLTAKIIFQYQESIGKFLETSELVRKYVSIQRDWLG